MDTTPAYDMLSQSMPYTTFRHGAPSPPAHASLDHDQQPKAGEQMGGVAVSIVSSSRLLCEALVAALSAYPGLHVAGAYPPMLSGSPPIVGPREHVILLDANLGQEAAIATIRHYQSLASAVPVVVLEVKSDVNAILSFVAAGAAGFSFQGAGISEVVETIDRVRQGLNQISPEVVTHLAERAVTLKKAHQSPPSRVTPLTPRELEVLRYIAEDYSNQEIAAALVIELPTVKNHVHSILEKLELQHRRDAARYAAEQGWLGTN